MFNSFLNLQVIPWQSVKCVASVSYYTKVRFCCITLTAPLLSFSLSRSCHHACCSHSGWCLRFRFTSWIDVTCVTEIHRGTSFYPCMLIQVTKQEAKGRVAQKLVQTHSVHSLPAVRDFQSMYLISC